MSEYPDIMPPVMPVNRFCEFSGFGRTTIYKLIKLGELQSLSMCGRRFIVMESYFAYVRREAEKEALAFVSVRGLSRPKYGTKDVPPVKVSHQSLVMQRKNG